MAVLTATFEPDESRVRLVLTGATGASNATFYCRIPGTSLFRFVRGSFQTTVTTGETPAVFDYEFPAGNPAALVCEYEVDTDNALLATATAAVTIADQVWLKFPGYPYLNRAVKVTDRSAISRSSRGDLVPIVNTRAPVAVQEFMAARSFSVTIRTATWSEFAELDAAVALGGIVFIHGDESALGLPSMFAVVQAMESEPSPRSHREVRYTTLRLNEVTQPGYAYAGTLGSWQTLLTQYATWQEVADSHPSWSQLLELEGSPTDVVVG